MSRLLVVTALAACATGSSDATAIRAELPAPLGSLPAPSGCASADPRVGMTAPDFTVPAVDGGSLSLADTRGQVTVLAFWASWCQACEQELPLLQALADHYRGVGVSLLPVSLDDEAEVAARSAAARGVTARTGYAGEDAFAAYRHGQLPYTLLVDRAGTVFAVHRGFEPACAAAIEAELREALR